eukprot:4503278-Pyramimonas_sp.AAC.1
MPPTHAAPAPQRLDSPMLRRPERRRSCRSSNYDEMRYREPSYIWGRECKHSYLPHRLSPDGATCRQQLRNASSQIIGAPLGMTQGYEYTD